MRPRAAVAGLSYIESANIGSRGRYYEDPKRRIVKRACASGLLIMPTNNAFEESLAAALSALSGRERFVEEHIDDLRLAIFSLGNIPANWSTKGDHPVVWNTKLSKMMRVTNEWDKRKLKKVPTYAQVGC